jgi:hypothetical protein
MKDSFAKTLTGHEGAMVANEVKQVEERNFLSCLFYSIKAPDMRRGI